MLKRMEVFMIASILILLISIIMVVYTMQREQEFKAHNRDIQTAVVDSAVYAIDIQLDNKRRHVNLFIDEYSRLFRHLERFPDDEFSAERVQERLQQRFPDFFTFTIANHSGIPVMLDFENLVGEACQADLDKFASKLGRGQQSTNEIFIHPQAFHYHYDVMTSLAFGNESEIFFVSFYLDEIADILKTHEVPGQQLFIVRQSDPDLIEVSREGARDKLKRNAQLTAEEQNRILVFANIPGTDWRLVNLPDRDFEQEYIEDLWHEVIIILSILTIAIFIMISVVFSFSEKRTGQ